MITLTYVQAWICLSGIASLFLLFGAVWAGRSTE